MKNVTISYGEVDLSLIERIINKVAELLKNWSDDFEYDDGEFAVIAQKIKTPYHNTASIQLSRPLYDQGLLNHLEEMLTNEMEHATICAEMYG